MGVKGNLVLKSQLDDLGAKYYRWYKDLEIGRLEDKDLLNVGIVGGHRRIVEEFLDKMASTLEMHALRGAKDGRSNVLSDMAAFNYIVYNYFADRFATGI